MVDAGEVKFRIEVDRASLDRSIADMERRLASVGNIDLKVADQGTAAAAVREAERAFAGVRVPKLDVGLDTSKAKADVLDLESAIASLERQRLKVDVDVSRGEASIANLSAQIQKLQDKRVQINANAQAATTEVEAIDERIKALTRNAVRLELDVESEKAQSELIAVNARIEKLEARRIRVQATVDSVDPEVAKVEAKINELNARKIKVEADTGQARTQLNELDKTLDDLGGSNADQALERLQRQLAQTGRAADRAQKPLKNTNEILQAFKGAASFVALDRLVDLFGELTQKTVEFIAASVQANAELRATENALSIVLGSQEAAGESIEFLREVSETTGQSFRALQGEYSGLSAAAAEAGVPQAEVNDLFAETSRVLAIFGKDSTSTGLAFNALTQIASKGVVSMEELRQQLGEQLPVAFGATARGLGITTAELNDLVASGELTSAEFIPAFTKGLKEIEGAAPAAQQAIAQLDNAIFEFQQDLGKSLEPIETAFSETFAAIFSGVSPRTLDPLAEAGERLKDSLADNPELAERLSEALSGFISGGAEAAAAVLDQINQALSSSSNVDSFAQGVETAGELLNELALAGTAAIEVLVALFGGSIQPGLEGTVSGLQQLTTALEDVQPAAEIVGEALSRIVQLLTFIVELGPQSGNALGRIAESIPALGTVAQVLGALSDFDAATTFEDIRVPDVGQVAVDVDLSFVDKFRDASEEVAENDERAARRAAAERVKANEEAVKEFKRANEEAIAEIETAQSNRIAGIRQNQASGNITESEADIQVAQIETESIRERIALREQEIATIQDLEQRGALSAEEAAKQTSQAKQAAADLTLEAVESEIQAQKEAEDAAKKKAEEATNAILAQLDAQSRLNNLQAEEINIQTGLVSTALEDQSSLLTAQVNLEQSRLSLSRQNLDAKLSEAQAAEDVIAVEELRDRILINQRQSIEAEFTAKQQQLDIQQKLITLEAERQVRLAQIAESEARIAVEKARQSDATTAEELAGLEQIVRLREEETKALRSQSETKQDVLGIQRQQLDIDQQAAEQRATLERREQAIEAFRQQQKDLADEQLSTERELASATDSRRQAAEGIVSALSSLQDISSEDALGNLDQLEENLRSARRAGAIDGDDSSSIQRAIDQAQSFSRSGGEFSVEEAFRFASSNENNPFASGVLDAAGLGGVNSFLSAEQDLQLADARFSELTTKIDEVTAAIENLAIPTGIENLTVSTPDPVADSTTILADMARRKREAAGVS